MSNKKTTHGGMPPPSYKEPEPVVSIQRDIIYASGSDTCIVPEFTLKSNNLWIFINGKKEYKDIDYIEVNSTTIKWLKMVPINSIIETLIFK